MKRIEKTPFNFLNSFSIDDAEKFFGRNKESHRLERLVRSSSLVLVHGKSGTGKTSVIQCGLGTRFEGPDWLPIHIRRNADLNASLMEALNKKMKYSGEPTSSYSTEKLLAKINAVYLKYKTPVYLIFDQFEEIFILGDEDEQQIFFKNIRAIIDSGLECKIVLVTREEFFVSLHEFDTLLPELFQARLRISPMSESGIKEVVEKSFAKFNMQISAEDKAATINRIAQVFTKEKVSAQLAYLQVYLDSLYRICRKEDALTGTIGEEKYPLVNVSMEQVEKMGPLESFLSNFIKTQTAEVQNELEKIYGKKNVPKSLTTKILDAFVSKEGTKIPVSYHYTEDQIIPSETFFERSNTKELPKALISDCIKSLEARRILKSNNQVIELSHDSIALSINDEQFSEFRRLSFIANIIINRRNTNTHLSKAQLAEYKKDRIALFEQELLSNEDENYWDNSEAHWKEEEEKNIKNKRVRRALTFVGAGFVLIGIFAAMLILQKWEIQAGKDLLTLAKIESAIQTLKLLTSKGQFDEAISGAATIENEIEKIIIDEEVRNDTVLIKLRQLKNEMPSQKERFRVIKKKLAIADELIEEDSLETTDLLQIPALWCYNEIQTEYPSEREEPYLETRIVNLLNRMNVSRDNWKLWKNSADESREVLKGKKSAYTSTDSIYQELNKALFAYDSIYPSSK